MYYNTFYNAKHNYRLAEEKRREVEAPGSRLTPAVYRELYKRVIVKASAVLDLYPKSRWVDDALLLIGKAFFWREEYPDALTKFQELQENFPKSELVPEAVYWEGRSLWAAGRVDEARVSLRSITEATDSRLFALSRLDLAEMEAAQDNHEEAIEAYQSLQGDLGKKHSLRARAWQGMGNSLLVLGRFDEALEAYRNVLTTDPDTKTNFETRVQIGTTLERQGRYDEALEAYEKILDIKRLRIYEAETRLNQAHVHRLKGQTIVAEDIYDAVAAKYPRSKYSAEAYYEMGLIAQQVNKDPEKAKELFEKASREDRGSDAGQAALKRQQDLVLLERYRVQAADAKAPEAALPPLFNLAELYLFNLGETDSALAAYQRALTLAADSTEFAPKAQYAIGLIYADSLNRQAEARTAFQTLIEQHPNTPYANKARSRLDAKRTDEALAEARFLEAESLKQEGSATEYYVDILQKIADEYPKSTYAPKALYALAWAYENDLDQPEAARTYYTRVRDRYPMTRFGELAGDKLKGDFLSNPESAVTDSTALSDSTGTAGEAPVASVDVAASAQAPSSTPMRAEDVDEPPELVQEAPLVYPAAARAEGRPATVVVRLLVRKDGHVDKAEVTSGPEAFHDAAVRAALQYQFKPAIHDGRPRDVWLVMSLVFEPPN